MAKRSTNSKRKDKKDTINIRRSSRIRERIAAAQKTSTDPARSKKNATPESKRNGVIEEGTESATKRVKSAQRTNKTQTASVVVQDTIVPQTTTIVVQSKRPGRPPKPKSTALSAADSGLSTDIKISIPMKRGLHAVEKVYKLKLKSKRRKGDTFTIPIPTRPQQICQVYAIGSNMFSQCGTTEESDVPKLSIVTLKKFRIVDISAGSIHSAALTADGRVVTWGCNDHGTLGRFTSESEEAEAILEEGKYDVVDEGKPAYAEGLEDVNIVKVVCGGSATFAITDQGHLYVTGTFRGKDGVIGLIYGSRFKQQPIFTRYTLFEDLTIVDIAAGVDHALALTSEGDVYAWGSGEAYRLGKKFSERISLESLIPFNLGLKHIVRLYSGSYHNFAIDNNGKVWVFGFNNMGQCGLGESIQAIVPPERHSFFNEIGQKVEEFAVGQLHTLARMQNGQVYSFGRSDYGQLGLGDSVLPSPNELKARVVTPTVVRLPSIKLVGAGDNFSMAVDTANRIFSWGFGESYVLGTKKEKDMTSPFRMPEINELRGKEIVRISCGSSHALFLVPNN